MQWKNKGHEFDRVGELLSSIKNVYLYGIGGNAEEILYVIEHARKWIEWNIYLVDRNPALQESGYREMPVMSPEQFFTVNKKEYIVVTCPLGKTGDEIFDLVCANGCPRDLVFSGWDFLYTYFSVYFLYAHDMVFFTSENILPSSACNLNCRDCLNFNPYIVKPIVYGIDEVKKDVDIFFTAVDLIYRFQVTGGEPLLYPHLKALIQYIDQKYRHKIMRLEMVTNGTIVPSDDTCSFLAETGVFVFLDDYTMSLPEEKKNLHAVVEDKFKKFGVNYINNFVSQWFRLYPAKVNPKVIKEESLTNLFERCANPWSTIEHGKISACNYSLYAQKAGVIEGTDYDFYDLSAFEADKKKELVEFRLRYNEKGYASLCKKCGGFSTINSNWCEPAIQAARQVGYSEVEEGT